MAAGSADLPHIAYARRIGFSLLDHRNPRSVLFVDDRRATAAERRGYAATADRIMDAIAVAGDVAVAECVATDLRFAGTVLAWRGALDHALEMRSRCLGNRLRGHLTDWATNPQTLGAYAAARPRRHGARALLARPLGARLFFAGEAAHDSSFALVAGAHRSGEAAATAALAALAGQHIDA